MVGIGSQKCIEHYYLIKVAKDVAAQSLGNDDLLSSCVCWIAAVGFKTYQAAQMALIWYLKCFFVLRSVRSDVR